MLAIRRGLARRAAYPLPHLFRVSRVHEDDRVLVVAFPYLLVNLLACGIWWYFALRARAALEDDIPALLGNACERIRHTVHHDLERGGRARVPPQLLNEQLPKREVANALADGGDTHGGR